MLKIGINGPILHSIMNIYKAPKSCVQLNGQLSHWFDVLSGVRQGDSLSPLLFSVFINDLAQEVKDAEAGVYMGGEQCALLMYADDIVFLSPDIDKAQKQVTVLYEWCKKWRMSINPKKSQVMHIRNHQKPRSQTKIYCGNHELSYTDKYKYLGYTIQEHLSHKPNIEILTSAAARSYGRIVNIFRQVKNLGFKTYDTLYRTYVTPIVHYGAAIWGFAEANDPQVLQNRVSCYYLGVHKFTPVAATQIIMDWLDMKYLRWCEIVRYRNRLNKMDVNRLPVKLYKIEKSLRIRGWVQDLEFILHYANMGDCVELGTNCDLDVLNARLLNIN